MKRVLMSLALCAFLALPALAEHPTKETAATPSMHMYHVVLVKNGPNWTSMHTPEGRDIREQVVANVKKAAREGKIVSAGLVNDETDVEFIFVFDIENKYEVEELLSAAPNVKNGVFKAEVYSWFATKIQR
jgi:uncharacterized protein YciI